MSATIKTQLFESDRLAEWKSELEALAGIHMISAEDRQILRQLIASCENTDSYLTSPIYYLFTGRNGLWVYKKGDDFILLCLHPNVPDQLLIFPKLVCPDSNLLAELLEIIPAPSNGIRLARIPTNEHLKHNALRSRERNITLNKCQETILDWKYPVRILSTNAAADLNGPTYKRLRYMVKQASFHAPKILSFDPIGHSIAIENLLHRWAKQNAASPEEYELLYAPYESLFSWSLEPSSGLSGLMIFIDDKLQALSLWDVSNAERKTANLYANFCNVEIVGLSEFSLAQCCTTLKEQGIEYLNLGGSETKGLDDYKKKFRPVINIDLCSADVEINDVQTIDLIEQAKRLKA